MSSTFGRFFRVTTFGESHGGAVGAVIDGCPPCLELAPADIQAALDRRRPGQSILTTDRQESDQVEILSGLAAGQTLGTPLAVMVRNQDHRPDDYQGQQQIPRPSHADFTYREKYGISAGSGGGRASARETVGRVAAGAVAEKFLINDYGVEIVAWVSSVGEELAEGIDHETVTRAEVEAELVRCPAAGAAARMAAKITAARAAGDSVGGVITCVCRGVPVGWGEPVFNKLEALLAQAMLSLPAVKGFEIGSGFAGTLMLGSQHNDVFVGNENGTLSTKTNHSGGVQGGISNGECVLFRVAFKPTSTIGRTQKTADYEGQEQELLVKGRHDPCVLPRAVPIVEAMAALVLADLALWQKSRI